MVCTCVNLSANHEGSWDPPYVWLYYTYADDASPSLGLGFLQSAHRALSLLNIEWSTSDFPASTMVDQHTGGAGELGFCCIEWQHSGSHGTDEGS